MIYLVLLKTIRLYRINFVLLSPEDITITRNVRIRTFQFIWFPSCLKRKAKYFLCLELIRRKKPQFRVESEVFFLVCQFPVWSSPRHHSLNRKSQKRIMPFKKITGRVERGDCSGNYMQLKACYKRVISWENIGFM